jgi:hypothetical protein
VLKKTSACTGLVIATAAGALLASPPAHAQVDLGRYSSHHHHRTHNRNWNGNHNRPRIFIRIYVYNKNNNRAQALIQAPRDRERPIILSRDRGEGVRNRGRTAIRAAQDVAPATSADQGPAVTNQDTAGPAVTGRTVPLDGHGTGGIDQGPVGDDGVSDASPTS